MSESKNNSNSRFGKLLVLGAFTLGFTALVWSLIISMPHLDYPQKSPINECINNLRLIDEAKQEWASETHHSTNDIPTVTDLTPYLKYFNGQFPQCPSGGTYTIGQVDVPPTCSITNHVLP
jgi:hypothetical protein